MLRKAAFLGALTYCALAVGAGELTGRVIDQDGKPLAGVGLKLLHRGDSAFTDAEGRYRLTVRASGVRRGDAGAVVPHLRGGELRFHARAGERVRLEAFDSRGRKVAGRSWRVDAGGTQGVSLSGVTDRLRGLGWLRLTSAGGARVLRVVDAGHGPVAAGRSGAYAGRAAPVDPVDSLRISKAGYYDVRDFLYSENEANRDFRLWKNSIHDLTAAEVEAWKQHLLAKTYSVTLSRDKVTARFAGEIGLVLADGSLAGAWSTDYCDPGPPPRSLRLAYSHEGTQYRDTISLEPYWAFLEGLQASRDSVDSHWSRYRVTWSLPESLSALPERDRMTLRISDGQYDDSWSSQPDVFQQGVGFGFEGGTHTWGEFSPRAGRDTVKSISAEAVRIAAWLTLARRPGHLLVMELSGEAPVSPVPKVAFRNAWPEGGTVRKGEAIELEVESEGKVGDLALEWKSGQGLAFSWSTLGGLPPGQSRFSWTFSKPLLSPQTVQLRVKGEYWKSCLIHSVSPILTVTPDPADTLMAAFEPNETAGQAALVPRAGWISAGWDYRGYPAAEDMDYFRFPVVAGEKVRFTLANPDSGEALLAWDCGGPASGITSEPGGEIVHEITVDRTADCLLQLRNVDGNGSTYRFRIDSVP